MTYHLKIEKRAVKEMIILSQDIQNRIKEKIRSNLIQNPFPTGDNDIKKIKGSKFYRLRVGKYRVFFDIDPDERQIFILSIRHRS